jgi:drug/metabolite transporter (DMT)-like permease
MLRKKLPEPIGKYFLALVTAHIIWAIAGPVIKITLDYLPPFTFLFIRFLIVSIIIFPYTIILLNKHKINPKDYINILLLGLFSQTSIIFIFIGLQYTTVLDAAIIGMLGPILAMTAGHYFYHEKVDKTLVLGVSITIIGTLLVVFEPFFSVNPAYNADPTLRLIGNIFIMLNSLASVTYVIWSKISLGQTNKVIKKSLHFLHLKQMTKEYPSSLLMSVAFYIGMFTLAPLAFFENVGLFGGDYINITLLPTQAIFGVLYMALLSSIVAYFLFEWSLKRISVTDSAIISYIGPLFAVPAAFIILGEIPNKMNIIGGAIIAIGIFVAEYRNGKKAGLFKWF